MIYIKNTGNNEKDYEYEATLEELDFQMIMNGFKEGDEVLDHRYQFPTKQKNFIYDVLAQLWFK